MKIKGSLKREANNYIVLPKIQKFLKDNKLGSVAFRANGIKVIEEFGTKHSEAKEIVNNWLDECVKEGIKYLYITKISFNKDNNLYKTELFWKEFSNKHKMKNNAHINEYIDTNTLDYRSIKIIKNNGIIDEVKLVMSLYCFDATNSYDNPIKESYPIFIDIDIEKRIVILRLKSKSKIYEIKIDEDGKECINPNAKIYCDKMASYVFEKIAIDIGFTKNEERQICNEIEYAYYNILNEITGTPKEIRNKINEFEEDNVKYITNMLEKTEISKSKYSNMIENDINILLEKFISISYPNKDIFKASYAFPIKLVAIDSEDTKVEETASDYQPLQTKAAFYDHKKIINEEKRCEGMTLAVYRKNNMYYGKVPFTIKCDLLKPKGFGRIRFIEYVEEEDIQNVLSRIISTL